MATFEEDWEFQKGFERAVEGKTRPESLAEETFGFVAGLFGFEKEQTPERLARVEGFKAGRRERSKTRYFHGETLTRTVKDMFGFDEKNVSRRNPSERERKEREESI